MQIGLHIRALRWFTKACLWYRIGYQLSYKQHIDLCPSTATLLKFDQKNHAIKYTTGKNKPSLLSSPIFTNVFYGRCAQWTGKACRFTLQHLIEITILKMMLLGDTWVWLWELVRWPALSSGLFIFVFEVKLYRSCHICDKLKSIGSIQWNTSPCKSQRWSASVDKWNTGFYQLMLIKEC